MIGSQKVRFNASRNLKFVAQNSMAFMKTNYSLSLFSILLVTNKDHRCRNDVCTSNFQLITLMQTMQHIRCYISANTTHTRTVCPVSQQHLLEILELILLVLSLFFLLFFVSSHLPVQIHIFRILTPIPVSEGWRGHSLVCSLAIYTFTGWLKLLSALFFVPSVTLIMFVNI